MFDCNEYSRSSPGSLQLYIIHTAYLFHTPASQVLRWQLNWMRRQPRHQPRQLTACSSHVECKRPLSRRIFQTLLSGPQPCRHEPSRRHAVSIEVQFCAHAKRRGLESVCSMAAYEIDQPNGNRQASHLMSSGRFLHKSETR